MEEDQISRTAMTKILFLELKVKSMFDENQGVKMPQAIGVRCPGANTTT